MNKAFIDKYFMQIVMTVFTVAVYGIGLLVTSSFVAWTLGVLTGLTISLLKLRLMLNTFEKAVRMQENEAKGYTQKQYMLRYVLSGAILLVAALSPWVSIVGVFVGLFSMKIGAYAELYNVRKGK